MSGLDEARYREDRVALQQYDEGDDDDSVWILGGGSHIAYHDDIECGWVRNQEEAREITRAAAKRRWKPPCRGCVLATCEECGGPTGGSTTLDGRTAVRCPECGRLIPAGEYS